MLVKRDFGLVLSDEEYVEVADYVFDKIKNDGRPFEFRLSIMTRLSIRKECQE